MCIDVLQLVLLELLLGFMSVVLKELLVVQEVLAAQVLQVQQVPEGEPAIQDLPVQLVQVVEQVLAVQDGILVQQLLEQALLLLYLVVQELLMH